MKKLTVRKAEQLAKKMFGSIKDVEEREWRIVHAGAVSKMACILAGKNIIDKGIFKIAGWVHDLGYVVEGKNNHAENSLKILEKEGYKVNGKLKDCILNHSSSGKPKTEAGKIFQVADKAAMLDAGLVKMLVKYNKQRIKKSDLEFVKAMVLKALDLLGELKF